MRNGILLWQRSNLFSLRPVRQALLSSWPGRKTRFRTCCEGASGSIPAIRDRVVQGALKLILEPIFEADFQPGSFGYRPQRTAHEAVDRVARAIVQHKTRVIDIDLSTARRPFGTCRPSRARLEDLYSCTANPGAVAAIVGGYHGTPFDILGIHQHAVDGKPSFVIRTFQPQALAVSVVRGDQACPMHRVHRDGFFEAVIQNQTEFFPYRLAITLPGSGGSRSKPMRLRIRTAIHLSSPILIWIARRGHPLPAVRKARRARHRARGCERRQFFSLSSQC